MTRELVSYATDEGHATDNSLLWKAREVLAGAAFSDRSDVYSFGIVLWEIMQEDGFLPYAGLLPGEVRPCSTCSVYHVVDGILRVK